MVCLSNPVAVTTNVEVWLANLTSEMRHTLHLLLKAALATARGKDQSINPTKFPSQVQGHRNMCMVMLVVWSHHTFTPVFFFIMCSRSCIFYPFSLYWHVCVCTCTCVPFVLCYRHVHVCFQLANTTVALASSVGIPICLCTPLSPAGVVSERTDPVHSAL